MRQIPLLVLMLTLLFPVYAGAQESQPKRWTLRECLDYALEHNIQVKKSKVSLLSGQEDTENAKAQMFPSLSASVSQNVVNYPSNDVATNTTYSGSYGVNANWRLFDGNRRSNTIKQQKLYDEINSLSIEQSENDIQISLVQTYMQVLYAYEAVRINENTVEVSQFQRDRAEELFKAGSISRVDLAQLESQYSTDKYQLVVARTNLDNYKLQLKQLLELDIAEEIEIEIPELTEEDVMLPLPEKDVIYMASLAVMPEIKSSELSIDVADLEIKKAKSGYYPTLSLNAGIGTGHTSGTDYSFSTQVWDRFNESIGLTLSIPIYSNRDNKTAVNKARLAATTSQLELLNAQKALLRTVEGVYLDATSSQNEYLSAVERVKYVEESFNLTQEQFLLGMKNTLELLTEKNNYLNARQQELQSKYMAIMSIQLLNIYQKKPVNVNY
ncbi:outer membrane protein [Parabacteroides sp. PF5-5]|uniref:TolC family protein n=1 Tax=unclassified Parabacteroides TaxID=2649774 RepID=UPI002473081B|nr:MULTISPECIES: TolC family protein [unclassified Parabacteroides]MDH6304866.1 outer membrane protein [Parabacteroides sp. PH5-39]MDH6316048.1 outer membrane protein [Parabacteroides sp. PF5-13]MDH6319705.1 outer membrane protein [Parabacteroides sp. PH5-13]MDH6323436.1 outer membrane protein [Parabacteroides sp. PH5-8]MDH6327056.1 outer membrane protein [Parabacteroides sp. PH5-41]